MWASSRRVMSGGRLATLMQALMSSCQACSCCTSMLPTPFACACTELVWGVSVEQIAAYLLCELCCAADAGADVILPGLQLTDIVLLTQLHKHVCLAFCQVCSSSTNRMQSYRQGGEDQ